MRLSLAAACALSLLPAGHCLAQRLSRSSFPPLTATAVSATDRASGRAPLQAEPIAAGQRATGWRVAGQAVGGFLGATVAGITAWKILDDPYGPDRRVKGDEGYTPDANTAYAVASFVGSTALIYLIGRGDGSRGSLAATTLGTGLPSIPLLLGRNEPYLPVLGVVFIAPLQALAGTFGYQQTRGGTR